MPRNEKELRDLALLLSTRAWTAAEISAITKCSRPVAYSRLRSLGEMGCKFATYSVRQGASGPESTAYALVENRASKKLLTP